MNPTILGGFWPRVSGSYISMIAKATTKAILSVVIPSPTFKTEGFRV